MARLFTAASSHVIRTLPGPHIDQMVFGPLTFATVIRRATDLGWHTLLAILTSGGTSLRSFALRGDTDLMQVFDGTSASNTTTAKILAADGWCLFVCTKTSGTTTPRFHRFVFNTQTWAHEDGHSTLTDGSAVGSGGFVDIGRWQTSDFFNGDIQASMLLKRSMTDSEAEQLVRGNWAQHNPDFLVEFAPDDNLVHVKDLGRARAVQTSVTGTARSASRGAPGFRHSVDNRRR